MMNDMPTAKFCPGQYCFVTRYEWDMATVNKVMDYVASHSRHVIVPFDGWNYCHDGEFMYVYEEGEWVPFNHETFNGNTLSIA